MIRPQHDADHPAKVADDPTSGDGGRWSPDTVASTGNAEMNDDVLLPTLVAPPGRALMALLAVADPAPSSDSTVPPVDVSGEVEWIRAALGDTPTIVLPAPCSGERATLATIAATLCDEIGICWLVAAGEIRHGEPCLWLEAPDGSGVPAPARLIAGHLAGEASRSRLIVLSAPCDDAPATSAGPLAEVGLHLAAAGCGAVLVVPAASDHAALERFLAGFFGMLCRDGQFGRALTTAYAAESLGATDQQPLLLLRLADGRCWRSTDVNGRVRPVHASDKHL
jgi:hypothetical protein